MIVAVKPDLFPVPGLAAMTAFDDDPVPIDERRLHRRRLAALPAADVKLPVHTSTNFHIFEGGGGGCWKTISLLPRIN